MDSSGNGGAPTPEEEMLLQELLIQMAERPQISLSSLLLTSLMNVSAPQPQPQPLVMDLSMLLDPAGQSTASMATLEDIAAAALADPVDAVTTAGPPPPPIATREPNTNPVPPPAEQPPTYNHIELLPANAPAATPIAAPTPSFPPWSERTGATAPVGGTIRILTPPPAFADDVDFLTRFWDRDRTLREWHTEIENITRMQSMRLPDGSGGLVDVSYSLVDIPPPGRLERFQALFYKIQRERWLAHKVANRWRDRVWRRRTQCNVDLIDMAPVPDRDAIYLTDAKHRTVYKFHRLDVYRSLLSNICMADEMLPTPRPPTNPWTNAPLTLAQTIGICQQLVADYGRRGRCPPVLFAAFCAAGYDVRRFYEKNASLLSQYAITTYFKDIHPHNQETVTDTILQLLDHGVGHYSQTGMRRFLRERPLTPMHREWLDLARDYTLYMNLHVQARRHWYDDDAIFRDARQLFQRMRPADPAGPRVRLLRQVSGAGPRTPPLLTAAGAASAATPAGTLAAFGEASALVNLAALLGSPSPSFVAGAGAGAPPDLSGNPFAFLQNSFGGR